VIDAPYADASAEILAARARALAPRKPLLVSEWSDLHRRLSSKGSARPGPWRTAANPPLREPMDCMSARSPVRDIVLMFPIQFGKTEIAVNVVGYTMAHDPGPIMVCLPGEVSLQKWADQKLGPMLEETPAVRELLTSTVSRESANRRDFKDFDGGQLYLEHAGSPARLKSTSVRTLIVDELDEFATSLQSGDDPVEMLHGRTSAFPGTYRRLKISTPGLKGISRTESEWEASDQRTFHVPCPHCGEMQPLEWAGLHWGPRTREGAHVGAASNVRYVCRECGAEIEEHHKAAMISAGRWVPANPGPRMRGYHINCLYYQPGLGPDWAALVEMWLAAQDDPAKLKTFWNDRLAQPYDDPSMRAVRHNLVADRAEPYALRQPPEWALIVTAGVDTQDNRLAVQLVAWGYGARPGTVRAAAIDYVELPGDPADEAVWTNLTELLNAPLPRAGDGALLHIEATAVDAGGHRTEAVKAWVRGRRVRRPMCIFGAVPNNAPVLSKPKPQDVNWKGISDKRGVLIWHVGTVGIKHLLFGRLSTDAEREAAERLCIFSDQLPPGYFEGLVSETFNPAKNRFEKKRGARNEPLDTWVYAYAATHHPELRLHRATRADWERRAAALRARHAAVRGGSPAVAAIDADVENQAVTLTAPSEMPGSTSAAAPNKPAAQRPTRGRPARRGRIGGGPR
jgi:phage terminase large subunit GpA-like protein